MSKIVECVPNISEGINPDIYQTVAIACTRIAGVKLLDVSPGMATNRTVITFAGPPDAVVAGAFEVIRTSKELIDMRNHRGEHPRMGATDVCPFVPITGVTLAECATLARRLAQRVGEELGVWVYLFEAAASRPERQSLAHVRKGEYEGLADREGNPDWKPDAGPAEPDPKFGAVAIGARKFLVAYNINLNTKNLIMAKDIAGNIRHSGRAKRTSYPDGEIIRNPDGSAVRIPGKFRHCKGNAWIIPEYNRAQVTLNLTDTDVTPIHAVFEEVARQADRRGMRVTGSEIVGLVPLQPILAAGRHFAQKQGFSTGMSDVDLINIAALSLGLSDVSPFLPEEKIVEYRLKRLNGLVDRSVTGFVEAVAAGTPTPGGGSVAALCRSMASALGAMVASLTYNKAGYEPYRKSMEKTAVEAHALKSWFLDAVDRDTDAYNAVIEAIRLPKETVEQIAARKKAVLAANQECTAVPLEVLEHSSRLFPILLEVVKNGNPTSVSDAGVGAICMLACAESAAITVGINLAGIQDTFQRREFHSRMALALKEVRESYRKILSLVETKIESAQQ